MFVWVCVDPLTLLLSRVCVCLSCIIPMSHVSPLSLSFVFVIFFHHAACCMTSIRRRDTIYPYLWWSCFFFFFLPLPRPSESPRAQMPPALMMDFNFFEVRIYVLKCCLFAAAACKYCQAPFAENWNKIYWNDLLINWRNELHASSGGAATFALGTLFFIRLEIPLGIANLIIHICIFFFSFVRILTTDAECLVSLK